MAIRTINVDGIRIEEGAVNASVTIRTDLGSAQAGFRFNVRQHSKLSGAAAAVAEELKALILFALGDDSEETPGDKKPVSHDA